MPLKRDKLNVLGIQGRENSLPAKGPAGGASSWGVKDTYIWTCRGCCRQRRNRKKCKESTHRHREWNEGQRGVKEDKLGVKFWRVLKIRLKSRGLSFIVEQ